jgi:WD40-like Beta Propeller Repeat
MKKIIFTLSVLIMLFGCKPAEYLKFDNNPPGLQPKVFAANLISKNNEYVGYCAFSPDGSELYYAITNSKWTMSKIIRISSHNLAKKDTMYLKDRLYEGEPFVTKDGKSLYFTAVLRPPSGKICQSDIYRVNITANGWSVPEKLDSTINSFASEWHISFTNNNIAYFTSERENGTSALHGDIFRAELKDNKFVNVTKLPAPINTDYNDSDPLIAPDESYLIFHSNRPGGFGEHDL